VTKARKKPGRPSGAKTARKKAPTPSDANTAGRVPAHQRRAEAEKRAAEPLPSPDPKPVSLSWRDFLVLRVTSAVRAVARALGGRSTGIAEPQERADGAEYEGSLRDAQADTDTEADHQQETRRSHKRGNRHH
jgi:hypothetical protein